MDCTKIINKLSNNKTVFKELLSDLPEKAYLWKPIPERWCLLEVVCHLYNEEREDFRARTEHLLESQSWPLPPIDPEGWVKSRGYIRQNYNEKLNDFIAEREQSIRWLQSLSHAKWDNACRHPEYGTMTAKMFLSNWPAHDYLHFRQITKLKYDYLKKSADEDLSYAGKW